MLINSLVAVLYSMADTKGSITEFNPFTTQSHSNVYDLLGIKIKN